ncbi:hypothetical protein [Streptomyces sp. WMMC897]|uniref:hypothetical protein n=1 Tax=Streptomyces sp. WMMC897 TaxID=3014782 RepID=UPI0022B719BD|nr:hypothetical protein [Streptomyces sp. WMMC897]MCZ7416915.1 hypothetical protein [Streptomyces sp. WMMC897]
MTVREEAHRLLDVLPEERLLDAIELLREWTEVERGDRPRRRFRTAASFDGDPDLGVRAKDIVRESWDGQERPDA